jgi:hypothetical protein
VTTTGPVDVHCTNCGGSNTLTVVGIVIGFLALGVSLTTLSVLLRPRGLIMKRLGARAKFKLTAQVENGTEPDLMETDATSVFVRVRIGLENVGDKEAANTTLRVLAPRTQDYFRWTDQLGREQPEDYATSDETLDVEGQGPQPTKYVTEEIPIVKLRTPAVRWVSFIAGIPPEGEARTPLRIKAQSDDLPDDTFEEVLDFEVRVRKPGG